MDSNPHSVAIPNYEFCQIPKGNLNKTCYSNSHNHSLEVKYKQNKIMYYQNYSNKHDI